MKMGQDYTLVSEYINSSTYVKIKHSCGFEYDVKPYHILNGRGCPKCSGKVRKDTEYFKNEILSLGYDDYEIKSEYKSCFSKILMRHTKCGKDFEITPNVFLRSLKEKKCGCTHCNNDRKIATLRQIAESNVKTHEKFLSEVYELVKDEYKVIDTYERNNKKICMRHNKCNNEYYVTPGDFLQGYRCPYCNSSKGEHIISDYLRENNIPFENQKKFKGCYDKRMLPFDFYIPSMNVIIEYDGEQHYKPIFGEKEFKLTKSHDSIKSSYCSKNNIKLIRIPYWEKENIKQILDSNLLESVSTIPDECKGVDSEISTESKRKALEIEKI